MLLIFQNYYDSKINVFRLTCTVQLEKKEGIGRRLMLVGRIAGMLGRQQIATKLLREEKNNKTFTITINNKQYYLLYALFELHR